MELKNSKTEANLMAAYSGESQARNKYTYYAGVAKNEGYEQIAAISGKRPTMKKNMPRSGSNCWEESEILKLICWQE